MTIAEILMFLAFGKGGGIEPTGTKQITANGNYDVTDYATASVAVPQPHGSKIIKSNGGHDVTNYAEAAVSVQTYKTVPLSVTDQRTQASGKMTISAPVVNGNDPRFATLQPGCEPIPGTTQTYNIAIASFFVSGRANEYWRTTNLYVVGCAVTAVQGLTLTNDPTTDGFYWYKLDGTDCSITITDAQ